MCGICGKVSLRPGAIDAELIERMCGRIVHRGPDAQGVHTGDRIGLGQRRLAVIDIDPRGTAPLANEDGTVFVTFNGEIYNFISLRERLLEQGHRFRTRTDTEVLVHLYEEHGPDFVTMLHGMFAFALWDSRSSTFLAARDRLGKKPFLYSRTDAGLTFASEFAAILADPDVDRSPDYHALHQYLTHQYVPSPASAFSGVRKLPAGHLLTYDGAGNLRVERYWAPPVADPVTTRPELLEGELVERLRVAVRRRLIADVSLGAFLSGGIDSGAVVALMAQETSQVKTFTIGLADSPDDERASARLVADRYGTDHHEFVVEPDAAALLPEMVSHYGEPFADSSALPSWYLSRETRRHVTVALSGDGGDESFAGYDAYGDVAAWQRYDGVPGPIRHQLSSALGTLLGAVPYSNVGARAERALQMLSGDTGTRYALHMSRFKPRELDELYSPEMRARTAAAVETAAEPWRGDSDALDWMMRHDQAGYLPDCLMVKVDIASMAHSLEVRSPFLDHEFVAFAASIPTSLKRNGPNGKLLLRSAVRHLLPRETLERRKTGFGIPVAHWLRTDLRPLLHEHVLSDQAMRRGLFDRRFVERMVREHETGRRDWSNRLWALIVLELWFRQFVD